VPLHLPFSLLVNEYIQKNPCPMDKLPGLYLPAGKSMLMDGKDCLAVNKKVWPSKRPYFDASAKRN